MLDDRYELDHEIGRGGMGSVWLAHDTVLDRDVAIKQIGMAHGGAEPDLERAEREAHLAASINHVNVVAVYDLVDEDGHQWLVMEHVDGPTLAELIRVRGSLDDDEVAPIVAQVAGALAAAHDHGIVHRDVKPSNILLTADGTAKLSDFGVARAQADASLTQTGLVTGSPAYLSPEVASGRTATSASDVWSLGATIFHAIAGHPPVEVDGNVLGAMYRIVHDEAPRLDGDGTLPRLVASMMQHDPDARPTMAEVAATAAAAPAEEIDLESTQGFAAFSEPAAPTLTTAFQPLEPPVTASAPPPPPTAPDTSVWAPASAPTSAELPRPAASTTRRAPWIALGAAAAAVVAVVLFAATRGGDDSVTADPPPAAASTSAAPAPSDTTPTPDGDASTTAALEGFVTDYLTTASNDPDAGFAMLTPKFQDESDGLKGYKGFWDRVKDLNIEQVSADPQALRVSYTYSYRYRGDDRSDAVTLQLEKSGDTYLIAGEA